MGKGLAVYAILALLLWRPLELSLAHIPAFLPKVALLLGLGALFRLLVAFPRWSDEVPRVPRFVLIFALGILQLVVENILVWGVAYSDQRKYDRTVRGLQDNVTRVLVRLGEASPLLNFLLRFKLTHTANQLLLVLGLAFSVLWDQVPYSGFGLMTRYILTLTLTRWLRTACFLSVVLPHPQGYGCYPRRFPPPPTTWAGFLRVGMSKLKGTGGCNDLVYSGHGTVWVLTPLTYQAYYRNPWVTALLWAAFLQTSLRTALERQHYSLDMLLAGAITALLWGQLEWVYPPYVPLPQRLKGGSKDRLNPWALGVIGVVLLCIGILIFIAKA